MSSESQLSSKPLRPDVGLYEGINVVDPKGVGAIASMLRTRPSSDLALVCAIASEAFLGWAFLKAGQPAGGYVGLALPCLMWLYLRLEEKSTRVIQQTRALQHGAQPDS